jgi:hypothetical protein
MLCLEVMHTTVGSIIRGSLLTLLVVSSAACTGKTVLNDGADDPIDDIDAASDGVEPADAATGTPDADPDQPDATPRPDANPNGTGEQPTRLRVTNQCSEAIWLAHSKQVINNPQNPRLGPNESKDITVADSGLASARFWPKTGCDANGNNCAIGQNGEAESGGQPCGPTGCQPPFDSKFEITFAPLGGPDATFYNLSLVDGYTLPFKVIPKGPGIGQNGCDVSDCSELTLDNCPGSESMGGSVFPQYDSVDLRVRDSSGKIIACLSPCKKWNYSAPFGLALPESQDPGLHMCCPTPQDPASGNCNPSTGCMSPDECRSTSDPVGVERTDYVDVVRTKCPSAYSYSYDDDNGLHACPPATQFEVIFCP